MQPLTQLRGDGRVAAKYGVEAAIFLDALMFWWRTNRGDNRNFYDGRWWSHNSIKAYEQIFPWWSAKQIRRIIDGAKEKGAVLSGNYNKDRRDRTFWYTPSDDLLRLYGEMEEAEAPEEGQAPEKETGQDGAETGKCICPNGQMHSPEGADSFAHLGTPLPCNTHVGTYMIPPIPPKGGDGREVSAAKYKPTWFDRLWEIYPRHTGRKAAIKAWDKLQPDAGTCHRMSQALAIQRLSAQWTDKTKIPHLSTWLNGERWTDDPDDYPPASGSSCRPPDPGGGWAPDPEVY